MKSVLISIQPKWCELIARGIKTIEVRKTNPKFETPFKCYIYCTKTKNPISLFTQNSHDYTCGKAFRYSGGGEVIGEFVCDTIDQYDYDYCAHPEIGMDYDCGDNWWEISDEDLACACLTESQFRMYAYPNEIMYGWHISDLVIYDKPKKLSDFKKYNRTCYYDHLGLAMPKCKDCKGCQVDRPPRSLCYVETLE